MARAPTAWRTPPTPNSTDAPLRPTFSGVIYGAVAPFGGSSQTRHVHLQVWRTSDLVMVYDATFDVTQSEKNQGYFLRGLIDLTSNTGYSAKFRTFDMANGYTPFSAVVSFTTAQGPNPPALTNPGAKLNVISGFNYQGTHSHPQGLAANAIEIEVYDSTGKTRLYGSGTLAATVANGGAWSVLEFHADLAWATGYSWRARLRDTANNWGPWTGLQSFKTNSAPATPRDLSPAEGAPRSDRVFSCAVSDPDGDGIMGAQIELVRVSTGLVVAGYPKAMTVAADGRSASFTAPPADMVLTEQYRYRVRATDGLSPGYGSWSSYVTFTYADAPTVTLLAPASALRRNLVKEPSAEYAPESGFWSELSRNANDHIDRVVDGDAEYGVACWEGVESATSNNRKRGLTTPVDATKPYLLRAGFQWRAGVSSRTDLKVLCYDGLGALIGTLFPSSIALANGTFVGPSWTPYGGIVWPIGSANTPAFPAGTTDVRVEVAPSIAAAATVRFDAVSLEQVPLVPSAAQWARTQPWFGYADGDTEGYGIDYYSWEAAAGASDSMVLPILESPAADVVITYSGASAKKDDRLYIERWDASRGVFVSHYDSGWVAGSGARTVIPLPSGGTQGVRNEARYRLKVEARDQGNLVGASGWAEFDVRYVGPPQLSILTAKANTAAAAIDLTFTPSGLTALEFGGIEVAVESDGDGGTSEPRKVVLFSGDVTLAAYSWHFPVSGRPYVILIRQIKNVGADQVEGRWSRARVTCDYAPMCFIKDVEDPAGTYVAFKPLRGHARAPARTSKDKSHIPWGSKTPVHVSGEALYRRGKTAFSLGNDPGVAGLAARAGRLKKILEENRGFGLLLQEPEPEKVFAGRVEEFYLVENAAREVAAEFVWEETSYAEDFYVREGLVR